MEREKEGRWREEGREVDGEGREEGREDGDKYSYLAVADRENGEEDKSWRVVSQWKQNVIQEDSPPIYEKQTTDKQANKQHNN